MKRPDPKETAELEKRMRTAGSVMRVRVAAISARVTHASGRHKWVSSCLET